MWSSIALLRTIVDLGQWKALYYIKKRNGKDVAVLQQSFNNQVDHVQHRKCQSAGLGLTDLRDRLFWRVENLNRYVLCRCYFPFYRWRRPCPSWWQVLGGNFTSHRSTRSIGPTKNRNTAITSPPIKVTIMRNRRYRREMTTATTAMANPTLESVLCRVTSKLQGPWLSRSTRISVSLGFGEKLKEFGGMFMDEATFFRRACASSSHCQYSSPSSCGGESTLSSCCPGFSSSTGASCQEYCYTSGEKGNLGLQWNSAKL